MQQGVQIFDGNSKLQFDSAAHLGRVSYCGPANQSGLPNGQFVQVIDPALGFKIWAVAIPNYPVDLTADFDATSWQKVYPVITIDQPTGRLAISGTAYNSTTTPTTVSDYAYQNSTLIWGVY